MELVEYQKNWKKRRIFQLTNYSAYTPVLFQSLVSWPTAGLLCTMWPQGRGYQPLLPSVWQVPPPWWICHITSQWMKVGLQRLERTKRQDNKRKVPLIGRQCNLITVKISNSKVLGFGKWEGEEIRKVDHKIQFQLSSCLETKISQYGNTSNFLIENCLAEMLVMIAQVLPLTMSSAELAAEPPTFVALHMYFPASSWKVSGIMRDTRPSR